MKILYLPIIEPGAFHDVALRNKRGLLDALGAAGHHLRQVDYLAHREVIYDRLVAEINLCPPDLLLTQLHGHDVITSAMFDDLREFRPHMQIVNWSGDSWAHSLTSPDMLELCRHFDLQLVASPNALPIYEREGIRAAYWQIAYEAPVGDLPEMPTYDIVFLGNVISEPRREMLEMLRALPYRVGIYGDWEHADGHNTYDFGEGEALYKNARLAIADNVYPDTQNYISNRPFQILMAGGALMLHQHVENMEELAGLRLLVDYAEWRDLGHLREEINYWMSSKLKEKVNEMREFLVKDGQAYAREHHTYTARVAQLFDELLPMIKVKA